MRLLLKLMIIGGNQKWKKAPGCEYNFIKCYLIIITLDCDATFIVNFFGGINTECDVDFKFDSQKEFEDNILLSIVIPVLFYWSTNYSLLWAFSRLSHYSIFAGLDGATSTRSVCSAFQQEGVSRENNIRTWQHTGNNIVGSRMLHFHVM